MSIELQDVLAALPQIFPGVQKIPLDRIRPNPDNPGPPITEDLIADLADNLSEVGLQNPIKVMPDRGNPLAEGVSPHSENPKLKANGQPWAPGDFNWVILAGERRWRAYSRLKREGRAPFGTLSTPSLGPAQPDHLARLDGSPMATIPAFILNPNPEEAVQITHLDNDVRQRGWWADYQSIEALIKANPKLSQRQVAAKLKMDKDKVGRAASLLPLLNPEARALVVGVSDTQNKGNWRLSEMAASELAGLASGPATPEAQDLVRRSLAAFIDHQMAQPGVKGLVQWVKQGNMPEDYQTKGATRSETHAKVASPLAKAMGDRSAPAQAPTKAKDQEFEGTQGNFPVKASTVEGEPVVGAAITGNILWKQVQQAPVHIANRVFPRFVRIFHATNSFFQKRGVKNPVWATFLTAFLVLWVGSFLINQATRLVSRALLNMSYSRDTVTQPTHLPPGPQAGGQALVVPSQGAEGTQMGSAQALPVTAVQVVSQALIPTPLMAQASPKPNPRVEKHKSYSNSQAQSMVIQQKPVTVMATVAPQNEDQTGKVIGDAAGEAAKRIIGF